MAAIRNLILDWSGTLADDFAATVAATNDALVRFGGTRLTKIEFRAKFRLPFADFYREAIAEVDLEALEPVFQLSLAGRLEEIGLVPGAAEFLRACRRRGLRLEVLTAAHPERFNEQAGRTGVRDCFDRVHSGVRDKVAALPEILSRGRMAPAETAFVGDMVHDIKAARAAGVVAVAVLSGYDSREKLAAAGPDWIVESVAEAFDTLELSGPDDQNLSPCANTNLRRTAPEATA